MMEKSPTGRLSRSAPNMQTLGPRTPEVAAIKAAFIRDMFERSVERVMEHKCSNGASDTADNDLQRPDPTR